MVFNGTFFLDKNVIFSKLLHFLTSSKSIIDFMIHKVSYFLWNTSFILYLVERSRYLNGVIRTFWSLNSKMYLTRIWI